MIKKLKMRVLCKVYYWYFKTYFRIQKYRKLIKEIL